MRNEECDSLPLEGKAECSAYPVRRYGEHLTASYFSADFTAVALSAIGEGGTAKRI